MQKKLSAVQEYRRRFKQAINAHKKSIIDQNLKTKKQVRKQTNDEEPEEEDDNYEIEKERSDDDLQEN